MKALTIRQPWASLIALGVKRIETRSWRTSYRGRLAIHAGQQAPGPHLDAPFIVGDWWAGRSPLWKGWKVEQCDVAGSARPMPLGAIVATANLVACVPMKPCWDRFEPEQQHCLWLEGNERMTTGLVYEDEDMMETNFVDELPYGDFTPGRWAWLFDDVKPTTERCPVCWRAPVPCPVCEWRKVCPPIPAKGRQGLWEWRL